MQFPDDKYWTFFIRNFCIKVINQKVNKTTIQKVNNKNRKGKLSQFTEHENWVLKHYTSYLLFDSVFVGLKKKKTAVAARYVSL